MVVHHFQPRTIAGETLFLGLFPVLLSLWGKILRMSSKRLSKVCHFSFRCIDIVVRSCCLTWKGTRFWIWVCRFMQVHDEQRTMKKKGNEIDVIKPGLTFWWHILKSCLKMKEILETATWKQSDWNRWTSSIWTWILTATYLDMQKTSFHKRFDLNKSSWNIITREFMMYLLLVNAKLQDQLEIMSPDCGT